MWRSVWLSTSSRVSFDEEIVTVCLLGRTRGFFDRWRNVRAYLGVFVVSPLILSDVGVHLVAPALRALLAGTAGHLLGHGGPAVAVLRLRGDGDGDICETGCCCIAKKSSVGQTRRARAWRGAGRTWRRERKTSSASVHGAPLRSTGSAMRAAWVLKESLRFMRVRQGDLETDFFHEPNATSVSFFSILSCFETVVRILELDRCQLDSSQASGPRPLQTV